MPKTVPTDMELYRRNVRSIIKKHMEAQGIKNNKDLAKEINMPESTLNYRLKNPETIKFGEMHRINKALKIPKEERGELIG